MKVFKVLKNKNFSKIWLTQVLSLVTAHMLNFILIERIFRISDSTVAIGLFFALYYVPTVIFGPFVGVLIDRWNKKQIFIFSNLAQAFIVLFYLGLGERLWPIFTIALLYSLCDEFFNPAIGASLPAVVKKKSLAMANSFFFITTQGAIGLGYLLAGILLRFLGHKNIIFVLASLMLFSASLVASRLSKTILEKSKKIKLSWAHFQEQLIEGYSFIKNEPRVLFPILLLAGLQVFAGIAVILLPSIAKNILRISFADSSFVFIAPLFLGILMGNFLVGRLSQSCRKKNLISTGLFLAGPMLLILAFIVPVFKFSLALAVMTAVGLGIAAILMLIPSITLIQEHTRFNLRGRVFAALNTLVTLAAALPMLVTATLVDFFGVNFILVICGLLIIGAGFYARKGKYGLLLANHRA